MNCTPIIVDNFIYHSETYAVAELDKFTLNTGGIILLMLLVLWVLYKLIDSPIEPEDTK